MSTTDKLRDKLIVKAIALLDECKDEDKVDVFKAVSAFYIGVTKSGPKDQPPGKGGGTFTDLQRRLAGGATPVNGGSA
jgi:hypothetical protein